MLGCKWRQTHGLPANVPQCCLCHCCVLPMQHHHFISHDQAWLPPCISRWCRCRESLLVGESQSNPPLTKRPPWPVKPLKILGGSRPEDRVTEASRPVARGVHEEQHQMFPLLPPRKSLHLNEAAMPRPHALTLPCWWQNSAVVGEGETLSTCSRSTISTAYKPPIGRLNG